MHTIICILLFMVVVIIAAIIACGKLVKKPPIKSKFGNND